MCDNNISAKRLRILIDSSGKTREVIAKEIKCDTSTVTKHYNGDRKITVDYIIKYANYFKVSSDYLLGLSKAKTDDKDIQYICDYTGLSEESIRILNLLNNCNMGFFDEYISILNLLIEAINLSVDECGSRKEYNNLFKYLTNYYLYTPIQDDVIHISSSGKIIRTVEDMNIEEQAFMSGKLPYLAFSAVNSRDVIDNIFIDKILDYIKTAKVDYLKKMGVSYGNDSEAE